METEIITALGAIIVALLGAMGFMWRGRNGKNGNPNFGTIEVLCQQMLEGQRDTNAQLHRIDLTLARLDEKVGKCPAVQERR